MSRLSYAYCCPNIQPTGKYDSIMISYAGLHFAIAAETVYDFDMRRIRPFTENIVYSCTGTEQDVSSVNNWVNDYNHSNSSKNWTVGALSRRLTHKLFSNHPIGDREVVISGLDHYGGGCVKVWGPHRYFKTKDFHLGGMHAFEFINERKKFRHVRKNSAIWGSDSLASDFIREYYKSLNHKGLLLGNLVTTNFVSKNDKYLRVDDLRVPPLHGGH